MGDNDKKYKEYKKELDSIKEELIREEDKCAADGLSYDEMIDKTRELRTRASELDMNMRLIQSPTVQFGKTWAGDLMTIEDFVRSVENDFFTDDDGYGRYATETSVSDIYIYPSDILNNLYRKDFSHVMWFNK